MDCEKVIDRWMYYEERHHYWRLSGNGGITYEKKVFGESKIIFSAPHATKLFARGRLKLSEPMTGSLAEALAEYFGATSIKSVGFPLSTDPFKKKILQDMTGKLVIDLHGMRDCYDIDLCVGLGSSPNEFSIKIGQELFQRAMASGLRCSLNSPFDGSSRHSVTSLVQAKGGSVVQVEIASCCRKCKNHKNMVKIVQAFAGALAELPKPA